MDEDYIVEQIQYSVDNAKADGATITYYNTFEVYTDRSNDKMIMVMYGDYKKYIT